MDNTTNHFVVAPFNTYIDARAKAAEILMNVPYVTKIFISKDKKGHYWKVSYYIAAQTFVEHHILKK